MFFLKTTLHSCNSAAWHHSNCFELAFGHSSNLYTQTPRINEVLLWSFRQKPPHLSTRRIAITLNSSGRGIAIQPFCIRTDPQIMSNEKWDAYIINSFLCGFSKVLYRFDNNMLYIQGHILLDAWCSICWNSTNPIKIKILTKSEICMGVIPNRTLTGLSESSTGRARES